MTYWNEEPLGYDQHCFYCKAHFGIHDGLCADCNARFCEGAPAPVSQGLTDAEIEAMDRQEAAWFYADEMRREGRDYT